MKAEKLKPKTTDKISEELKTDYFEFFTPRPDAKIYQNTGDKGFGEKG